RAIVSVIILLLQATNGSAQYNYIKDYFTTTSCAKYQYYLGNFDSAIILMETAFKNAPYKYSMDEVVYAKCLYSKGDLENAFVFLDKGIADGFSFYFIDTLDFLEIFNDSQKVNRLIVSDKKFRNSLHD